MMNARAETQSQASPGRHPSALKLALTGLAAASIEWYDFFIYATAAALVFPTQFFPASLPQFVALVASFSTFAVGFLARPLGAVLFGHLGDRAGRRATLATAMILMGTVSTLIGCLPTYNVAGAWSAFALVVLRFAQGLAVGGQWGGAILLSTESAPASARGWFGSIAQAGVPVGLVLANLAFIFAGNAMSSAAFLAYGWRIPFWLSLVLVALGLYVRFGLQDTVAFARVAPGASAPQPADSGASAPPVARSSPVLEALRLYPGVIARAAGAYLSINIAFYIYIAYVVAYATSAAGLGMPRTSVLLTSVIASVCSAPALFAAGALSDRLGRRRLLLAGIGLAGAWGFVAFRLLESRSLGWIAFALSVGACLQSLAYGPIAAYFAELFETRVRYSAVSLAYQIASIFGGGLAPVIAAALYARFHDNTWIAGYIAVASVISFLCTLSLTETRDRDLDAVAASPRPDR